MYDLEVGEMRVVDDSKCKNCTHRVFVNVYGMFFDQEEQKQEQYYVCVLSYCPYDRPEKQL